ncbi:hypothetical protein ACSTHQ_01420 [Vibrio parahaemolyticus]|uniref:hypothetical protein n=1 Tax=Vibrio parahaemolyticus TaxID=670 RepID=UPI001D3064B4|nr:hypothetical protein [Vibrio parahaemolyticus]MBE5142901.1 hypothetical protein [Vibrio parahaemolyticus]
MKNGVWGVKDDKRDTVESVKQGDLVAFVYAISWLKAEGKAPKGFSRVSKDQLHNFRGIVKSIVLGRVSKSYHQSSVEVWPDEVYPHRFDFEIIESHDDNVLFGTEFFNCEFVEAVRYSACNRGSVTPAKTISEFSDIRVEDYDELEEETIVSSFEGKPILRLHKSRERSAKLVKAKKQKVLDKTGKLECEVCSVDFKSTYGELGVGYAECHHNPPPLSLRDENKETKLSDLAIVCSNCHRMLHRKRSWLKIETLKGIYEKQRS